MTAFAHSSNEPVLPLGTGITLESPLIRDHEINAVVRDPKVATAGYQATSGAGESGCSVPSPSMSRGFRGMPSSSTSQPNRSAGRYPDGADSDFNCRDFLLQNPITLLAASAAGSNNIKVASVADLSIGQKIIIDPGTNSETAVIKTIGTTGGTTVGTAARVGITVIPVASVEGFRGHQ